MFRPANMGMVIGRSKLTSYGQISVPMWVRQRLGLIPGSTVEWEEDGGRIVVRRAGGFSCEDIHRAVFGTRTPEKQTMSKLTEGIQRSVRKRHQRD